MPYSNHTNDVAASASPNATVKHHKNYLTDLLDANHILDTKNPYLLKKQPMNSIVQIEQPTNGNTTLR
jgi:hypothetical protein